MIVNVDLILENVIWIKSGITVSADVSIKIEYKIVDAKKLMFGILLYVTLKLVDI